MCQLHCFFKYFNDQCPNYQNKVFDITAENNFQLRGSFQILKCPFRKTNYGQFALSYIGRIFWYKAPDTITCSNNLSTLVPKTTLVRKT